MLRYCESPDGKLVKDENFTVEEASRFLTCAQPVPLDLLRALGHDCSMVCRIWGRQWTVRPTPTKEWETERAYPPDVIREVFLTHPATAPYVPR